MEAILARIRYSHADKKSGQVTSRHIEVPPGRKKTISIGTEFKITLNNSKAPTCRWTFSGETNISEVGWQNQQFTVPRQKGIINVLTVYREAVDTQHHDH